MQVSFAAVHAPSAVGTAAVAAARDCSADGGFAAAAGRP